MAFLVALPLAACGDDSGGGATPSDPELANGQDVFNSNCARCHGPNGEGGVGPALGNGRVEEAYPDIADQIAVITDGRNGMPAWGDELSEQEIHDVARYERELLGR